MDLPKLACAVCCRRRYVAPARWPGIEIPLLGSKRMPRSSSFLRLFGFSLPPEVGTVLDDDAVPRVHQQEQGDRGSNSGRDHLVDDRDGQSDRAWPTPIALV